MVCFLDLKAVYCACWVLVLRKVGGGMKDTLMRGALPKSCLCWGAGDVCVCKPLWFWGWWWTCKGRASCGPIAQEKVLGWLQCSLVKMTQDEDLLLGFSLYKFPSSMPGEPINRLYKPLQQWHTIWPGSFQGLAPQSMHGACRLLQLGWAGVGFGEEVSDACQVSQVQSGEMENANDNGLVAWEGSGFPSSE